MSGYLADTSVFVAAEQRRPLGEPPAGEARISVATLTELLVGVRRAKERPLRRLREETVARARRFARCPTTKGSQSISPTCSPRRASGDGAPVPWTRSSRLRPWPMI